MENVWLENFCVHAVLQEAAVQTLCVFFQFKRLSSLPSLFPYPIDLTLLDADLLLFGFLLFCNFR